MGNVFFLKSLTPSHLDLLKKKKKLFRLLFTARLISRLMLVESPTLNSFYKMKWCFWNYRAYTSTPQKTSLQSPSIFSYQYFVNCSEKNKKVLMAGKWLNIPFNHSQRSHSYNEIRRVQLQGLRPRDSESNVLSAGLQNETPRAGTYHSLSVQGMVVNSIWQIFWVPSARHRAHCSKGYREMKDSFSLQDTAKWVRLERWLHWILGNINIKTLLKENVLWSFRGKTLFERSGTLSIRQSSLI